MVNVSLVLHAEIFIDEIKDMLVTKVREGLKEQKITVPGGTIDDFSLLTQSFVSPTVVCDGDATVSLKSKNGEPVVMVVHQPIYLEAQKKKMNGVHDISLKELSHALDKTVSDEHFRLANGQIEIEIMITAPRQPCPLGELDVRAYVKGHAAQMTPLTDLGDAIPLPGIRDIIQNKFIDKLRSAETDVKRQEIPLDELNSKLKSLPGDVKGANVNKIQSITNTTNNSFSITATVDLQDAAVPKN